MNNTQNTQRPELNVGISARVKAFVGRLMCGIGWHDWRYASNYRRKGQISRARCQRCQTRKWEEM